MTSSNRALTRLVLGFAAASFLAAAPASAHAGFLEQLFGGAAQPEQPAFGGEPQQPAPQLVEPTRPKHHARRPTQDPSKNAAALEDKPTARQMPTDIWHDKTLRVGDAYMMKDGLHVYNGADGGRHTSKQFVPLVASRQISSETRTALVAMDSTRNDPLKKGRKPDTLASGRSASVGAPLTEGVRITDARGASIRYVGP